ncbi:MAG: S-layer homology domain-containing protein [Clostridia bacterium]|nr:S-layer homology domain-containing protein [Clostridia bacterium]
MKRLTAVILAIAMIFSVNVVFAETGGAESVLIKVKEKIDVPEELTEFEYSEQTYSGSVIYSFSWRDEDFNSSIDVTTDKDGNITYYYAYTSGSSSSEMKLVAVSEEEALAVADAFIKKALPEFAEGGDVLQLREDATYTDAYGDQKNFTFIYSRWYKGIEVYGNTVTVRVRARSDDVRVTVLNSLLDYDAEFAEDLTNDLTEADYMEVFPIDVMYKSIGYKDDTEDDELQQDVRMVYVIEQGLVAASDKAEFTPEANDITYETSDAAAGDSESTNGSKLLTQKELDELDRMDSLLKADELEEYLRGMEELDMTDDMTLDNSYTYKAGEGEYTINLSFENEDGRYLSAQFDAVTGELLYLYNSGDWSNAEYTDAEYDAAAETMRAFLEKVASDKMGETSEEMSGSTLTASRVVNGIKYPANYVKVSYNVANNRLRSYSVKWDDDVSYFPNPDNALAENEVYAAAFGSTIEFKQVLAKRDGVYVPAATIDTSVTLDAMTGESVYKTSERKTGYDDIEGHWAEDEIQALLEQGIYLEGDSFNPDDAATQGDMIRLFGAAFYYVSYARTSEIDYAWLAKYRGIDFENADENALATREDAFVCMAKMMGCGDLIELDIYKETFADADDFGLVPAKGAAAILKGMGILNGDYARPQDYLTRAEAAVMVYRYLTR